MEEWRVTMAGGVYVFGSLTDATNWIAQQTEQPATLARYTMSLWDSFGTPGGTPWPTPPAPLPTWGQAQVTHNKMQRK